MINVNGVQVAFDGSFQDLTKEAAFILHSLAGAAIREVSKNTDVSEDEIYDQVIKEVLEYVSSLKKYDPTSTDGTFDTDHIKGFKKKLYKMRQEYQQNPEVVFVNLDSSLPKVDASDILQNIRKNMNKSKKNKK